MQRLKETTKFLYQHHFIRYLFVGGSTFVIDFSLLYLLHGRLAVGIALATSIAYWTSILYNFTLNRNWTFAAQEKQSLRKHLVAYLVLLGFNYLYTVIFIAIASKHINYLVAKIVSLAIQMAWTYLAYKKLIFVTEEPAE